MKYALILPDGAADDPVDALDGQTPLEAAAADEAFAQFRPDDQRG